MLIRLAQKRLEWLEFSLALKLCNMGDVPAVRDDLDEHWIFHLARQMNGKPEGVAHDHQVGKDSVAPHEHVAVSGYKLHLSE